MINKQLGASLDVKHNPRNCKKRQLSVNLVELMDNDHDSTAEDFIDEEEGTQPLTSTCTTNSFLQSTDHAVQQTSNSNSVMKTNPSSINNHLEYNKCNSDNGLSESNCITQESKLLDPSDKNNFLDNKSAGIDVAPTIVSGSCNFSACINKLQSSSFPWPAVQKSKSPRVAGFLNNFATQALIDSGAELNVLDEETAKAAHIGITSSLETAQAANKTPLQIKGQSEKPVYFKCSTAEGCKMLNLGIVLVVQNLGVSCLIGQPGIENNNVICLPKKKIVVLAGGNSVHHVSYSSKDQHYTLARAPQAATLLPGESIAYSLPTPLSNQHQVAITPRQQSLKWLHPAMQEVQNGRIRLVNSSESTITVKKHDHIADLRSSRVYEINNLSLTSSLPSPDKFQFRDLAKSRPYSVEFLKQIKVDPDEILQPEQREKFHDLHRKFAHLFTTQPGKYNGHAGYVENRLQFASPPAPNSRTHIPCYSPSMNKLLAEKMDKLEEWGVLVSPEKVGVAVQFVSPSMLVPKPDSPDYRLVTDFAALNRYLKRVPNTSATITQAKARIAKAKHVVHLDLSNYFYQTGLQYDDIKYLGTVHPFKGLKVYTCDPQGLKGASERSYENS